MFWHIFNLLNRVVVKITNLYYRRFFKAFGRQSFISKPLRIQGGENIRIGNNVSIHKLCWFGCLPLTPNYRDAQLTIGDNCFIGDFNHIWATGSIIIENDVLTANHVYISDNQHGYTNPTIPIKEQPIIQLKPVVIGSGSWLGENVCVIGASIGRHCIIGANSVVTHDIPDYSVAVGSPARVIKKFNKEKEAWEKV